MGKHDGVKVVKPPDLIFLQEDVLYLRFDLIKEILRRLHRYGDAALFDDEELQPLWDILSTLNVRKQEAGAEGVGDD